MPILLLLVLLLLASWVVLLRLWQTVREMGRRHERVMRAVVSRTHDLEATLSSMVEGVLAVDLRRRVLSMNDAAATILDIRHGRGGGLPIDEVIASPPLRRLIDETLEAERPMQTDVQLPPAVVMGEVSHAGRRLYRAQAAVLRDTEGRRIGSLIVLHDVTLLRRLEVVRRDFVANASHEIKTPVTAIKAAAETLLDGGTGPEASQRFVGMIDRQADRLQALVEDLLSLARIEEGAEKSRIVRRPGRIAEVLDAAAEASQERARSHRATVEVRCDPDLTAPIDRPMLEQAVINLLDNAIKYGADGGTVRVTAEPLGREVVIAVHDQGPGIPEEHLPRIFERFYRTDTHRSRQLGGTGLGLSIVRHIAMAHGGRATVDSTVGRGSTFRIHISTAADPAAVENS